MLAIFPGIFPAIFPSIFPAIFPTEILGNAYTGIAFVVATLFVVSAIKALSSFKN